ncbi:MAG TPA: DUF4252 domain-containing protein [Terriglobia bacterium]|nr:DUF4252 domain-containing protein [Terriglobia bacterium]
MRKLMVVAWMLVAGTCLAQQIDLKSLDKFAALAKSKTEITMDEAMLKSAAGFLSDSNKEEAAAKKSAKDLKGFFLRAYEFPQKGMFKLEDLKPLLDQLKGPGWTSFLRAQEDDEQTEIWMHRTNGQMDGFLLIAAEDQEVVVMNALGVANLSDLAALGEFGKLAGAAASTPQPTPTAPGTAAPKPAGQKDDD